MAKTEKRRKSSEKFPSQIEHAVNAADGKKAVDLVVLDLRKAAGFTLHEIKELLDLDSSEDRARAHQLAKARVKALDERIAELKRARDALQRLARQCGGGGAGPCLILASFES